MAWLGNVPWTFLSRGAWVCVFGWWTCLLLGWRTTRPVFLRGRKRVVSPLGRFGQAERLLIPLLERKDWPSRVYVLRGFAAVMQARYFGPVGAKRLTRCVTLDAGELCPELINTDASSNEGGDDAQRRRLSSHLL